MRKGDIFVMWVLIAMAAAICWVDRESPYVWYRLGGDVLIVLWIFRHDLGLSKVARLWWRGPERAA